MKKLFVLVLMTIGLGACNKAMAQADELAQLALDIEKLAQLKQILTDLKKGYEILSGGYNTIKNISQGNFSLHKTFLDGLMAVSPEVKKYKRIADIINDQVQLVKEYKSAFNRLKNDGHFSEKEIEYMATVYGNLFSESLHNLADLTTVITENKLRMSDDERLKAIDRVYASMENKLMFLHAFNNNASLLAMQRMKEENNNKTIQSLYDVNH